MEANAAFIEFLNASEEPLFCEVSDVPGMEHCSSLSCDPFAGRWRFDARHKLEHRTGAGQ
jgi:hypothetical protein